MVRAPCEFRRERRGSSDGVRPFGLERGIRSTRFFVARSSDLAAQFRQPPTSNPVGFIDAKSVEKYEDNWEILR
jgi:hypothetical protein